MSVPKKDELYATNSYDPVALMNDPLFRYLIDLQKDWSKEIENEEGINQAAIQTDEFYQKLMLSNTPIANLEFTAHEE